MLGWYKLFIGSKASFLKPFGDNGQEDLLYNRAVVFWDKLDSAALWLPFIVLFVGGGLAAYYYSFFNNKPGRRYLPRYWYIMMVFCTVFSFILSLIVPVCLVGTSFNGSLSLESKLAFGNMCYTILLYFVVSFVWCKWGKTNAYRYL